MNCENCGKEIKDGAKFCPYCGVQQTDTASHAGSAKQTLDTPVMAPNPQMSADKSPKKSKRGLIVLLLVLVLLAALAAVGYFVVLPRWKEKQQGEYLAQVYEAIDEQNYTAAEKALAQAEEVLSDGKTELMAAQLAVEQGNYEEVAQQYKAISAKTLQDYTPTEGEIEKLKACTTKDERTKANEERTQESDVYLVATVDYDEDEMLTALRTCEYLGNQATKKCFETDSDGGNIYLDDLYVYETNPETGELKGVQGTNYDKDGNIDYETEWIYDEDGKQLYQTINGVKYCEYEYYDNGTKKKETVYENDGTTVYSVYEYDERGKTTKYEYYTDGIYNHGREFYDCDKYGNYTRQISRLSDGSVIEWILTYTYNEDGLVLTTEAYNASEGKTEKYSRTRDEHGNVLTYSLEEDGESPVVQWSASYTYDENGLMATEVIYYSDEDMSKEYTWTDGLLTKLVYYFSDGGKNVTYYCYAQKDQQPSNIEPMTYIEPLPFYY